MSEGFIPDAQPETDFQPDPVEAQGDNLGVYPMPSKAEHMATLAEIQANPVSLTAYRAARGHTPEVASKALSLAKTSGFTPQFVADNAEAVQQADEQSGFEDALGAAPILAAYAGKSPVHAAAIKDDVTVLQALEQGFADLGYQEAATIQMSYPGFASGAEFAASEEETAAFNKRHSGVAADLARAAPSIGAFFLAGKLGRLTGGKAGELGAQAALMYGLNRGTIYRRILASAPDPDEQAMRLSLETGKDTSDEEYAGLVKQAQDYEQKARTYATVGAGVSAAVGTGLSSLVSLATRGGAKKVQTISNEIVARAFTDPAVRSVVDRLGTISGHTLSGALYMAVPAVIDDATVQKAVTGEVDVGKAIEAGWDAFKRSLLAAGALAAIPHALPIARDVGRATRAPQDIARLDGQVEQAKASKLRERAPEEFRAIVREQAAQGRDHTVYVSPDAPPEATQKLVELLADEGQAVALAQATGTEVPVPVEKYLANPDLHESIRDNVKLDPEGMTLREAAEWQNHIRSISEPLNNGKLTEKAEAGPSHGPTDSEIRQTLDKLRAMGFQIPELKPIAGGEQPAIPTDSIGWARKLAEEGTIGELNPSRYERAAKNASDKLARIAVESAEGAQGAARQAFTAAGTQALEGAAPAAGQENLKAAGKKADKAAKALAEVPKLEQARDLARAQAQVHEEVAQEMGKARDYLAKRDTDKFRLDLAKASPEYKDAFDALQEAIDENTPRAAPNGRALDALLMRMDSDGESVGQWAEDVRPVLEQPRGWKGLSPAEGRAALAMTKALRAAAVRQNEIALAGRKQSLRDAVSSFREDLDDQGVPPGGPPAPSRASQGHVARGAERVGNMAVELIQPLRILRDRMGRLGNAVADAFVEARNSKEALAREVGDQVYKFYELDLPKKLKKTRFDGVKGPGSPVFNDNLWTRQDLWEFALWWGSESGSDRIKAGLRITDSQAHEFMSQLTNAEADLLDAKWKLNDETIWPKIRDHEMKKNGVAPSKIEARPFTIRTAEGDIRELRGGYEPALYRRDAESTAKAPENAETIADYWGSLKDGFDSTPSYFLKERVQRTARTPDLDWRRYSGHVNSVLQYLAFDDFVRNTGRVFRDPEFRELVQQRLGPQHMQELDKFLGVAARGRTDVTTDGAAEWNRMVGGFMRGRMATVAFKLNPRIMLGQLSHLPASAAAVGLGPQDMLYGLSQAFRPSTWGDSFDASRQLPYRWNGYGQHMREMLANIGPGENPLSAKWLDAASWSGYHMMDGFLSKAIYEAAASKAERAGATPEAARDAGDRAVELMMPALNIAEQSSVARDRGVIGSLILVRNFPNTLYNVGAKLEWDARNQVLQSDPGWQRARVALGAYGAAAASYLGTVWAAHIIGRFLMGHGKEHDESTSQWLEREALSAPFYPIPFVGDAAATTAEAAITKKKFTQIVSQRGFLRSAPALQSMERLAMDIGKAATGHRAEDRVIASLRGASLLLNSSIGNALPTVQYGYDVATGRYQPRGPFDVAGGLLYGKRPRQAKNPFTVAQDLLSGD